MKTLCFELKEAIFSLTSLYFLLMKKLGKADRKFLEWIHKMFLTSKGAQDRLTQGIKRMLEKSDSEIRTFADLEAQVQARSSTSLKRVSLPYLERELNFVTHLNPKLQRYITEIRRQVEALNEEISLYMWYFRKTFDSNLSEKNHRIIKGNLDSSSKSLAGLARNTVENMAVLISELNNELK